MKDNPVALAARIAVPLRVDAGARVRFPSKRFDPGATAHFADEQSALRDLQSTVQLLSEYQPRLAAQERESVLVVLQALDAAGKDGAIKHVMTGLNPAGVEVHGFKVPSVEERQHDFLWRYTARLPRHGAIGIFNRSHYEEVLVVRVHPDLLPARPAGVNARPRDIWRRRFREINEWERYLDDNGTRVVKIFLNVSRAEQKRRFLERIDRAEKNWKFSAADVAEREHWDAYMGAYSQALTATTTAVAPWYVVPADHKWFARLAVASIVAHTLVTIDPHYPQLSEDALHALQAARTTLLSEPVTS